MPSVISAHHAVRPLRVQRALLLLFTAMCACTSADPSAQPDATARAEEASVATVPTSQLSSTPASRLDDAPDRFIARGDTTIRFRDIGQGEPVLLLHGYTDRLEMWRTAADSLVRTHRVIVPDLRGFGASSRFGDVSRYGTASQVADLTALLDHLDVPSAHVVGYSLGGLIAGQLALHAEPRVRSVTFVAAATFEDSARADALLRPHADSLASGHGLLPFFRYILPTWEDGMLRDVSAQLFAVNDSAALVATLRAIPALSLDWDAVARTRVPATVLVGRVDPMLPHDRVLARRWPGAELRELEGNDHVVVVDAPEIVQAVRAMSSRY